MTSLQTLRSTLARLVSERYKRAIKSKLNELKKRFADAALSYDGAKLKARLRSAGISESDTVLVHSNFKPDSGFQGTPLELANALVELIGTKGNLVMVSLPFRGAAYDYLALGKPFNVRKTMSMMGLVTEMFRRREGTLRSLHPTHPVLAYGKDAAWLVADHERCLYPCGAGSPFDKIRQLRGKLLFFDVSFQSITFFHHVEDLLKERIPFPIYSDRLFAVPAVDANGGHHVIQTYAFSKQARRASDKLEAEMQRQGLIRGGRVGNSRFQLATTADVVACFTAMVEAGNLPYGPVADANGGKGDDDV
jgi:aminoglycoside 3-N-acetyltransferase